jgi:hypothetical protein
MEFICPDPNAMVRAANVRSTLDAFRLIPTMGKRLIEKHQLRIDDLQPENFILVQNWLNALKELQTELGPLVVQKVGTRILENADFPPQFASIDDVLGALDAIYYLNHKGNVGHYYTTKQADGSWEVRCETPYPRFFEKGLIQGFCTNPRLTNGVHYQMKFIEGPPGGDVTCTIIVQT